MSKVKLALGAASLFLFIVGVKRSFDMEQNGAPAEPGTGEDHRKSRRAARSAGGDGD